MLEFAFGEMGMTPQAYYMMTPAEFFLKSRGFQKARWREWEHTRTLAYTTSAVNSTKRLPPMQRWMPLPTDPDKSVSDKRIKGMFEKLKQYDARRKHVKS